MKNILINVLFALVVMPVMASAQNFSSYPVTVRNIGAAINSSHDDYAPCLAPGGGLLYFTSYDRDNATGKADCYTSRNSSNAWQSAELARGLLNTKSNDGALSFSAGGRAAVFASDRKDGGLGGSDIYIVYFTNGAPDSIHNPGGAVNSKYWDSQPAISADGRTIYFVSNRPGGMGGTDIWVTNLDISSGNWSEAQPLGAPVNTTGDECSPFISADGSALYFSSKGHGGFGGYDVFMSLKSGTAWSAPANLGDAVNSEDDDMFFFAPASGDSFYFASDRKGGSGELDIYAGTPNVFNSGMFSLSIDVVDSITRKALPCVISLIDQASGEILMASTMTNQSERFSQMLAAGRSYKIEVKVRDFPSQQAVITLPKPNIDQHLEFTFGTLALAEFDLGKYEIPFFVTGYYRVNTERNLDSLFVFTHGPLKDAAYIESFSKGGDRYNQYKLWAGQVEGVLQTVVKASNEEIFPKFRHLALPNEYLEIAVSGYADPQPVRGGARYLEQTPVHYVDGAGADHVVYYNDAMDNLHLSGLRAHFAGELLDGLFRSAPDGLDYQDLMMNGKIKYVFIGSGVAEGGDSYAAQRRIRIVMTRRVGK